MKNRVKSYLFIFIISIIVSIPLFNKDFNIYYDDGIQHVCRLMGTYQSITEGQTYPVIMSNFCNQFGYSWNLFYSPITAYIPLLLHFITNSFILDLKIFMLFISILSGISMYEFVYKVTKNQYAGVLGAVIYILTPYRLTDMYIRIAIAELTSFIFLPMIFQGLYLILDDDEKMEKGSMVILIVGGVGLILSHTIIAMYTAIIGLLYIVIHAKKLKDRRILKQLLVSLVVILCITSFFWAPMLEHRLKVQYEVFKAGRMERIDVLIFHKLDFIDLLCTKNGQMSFEIGLVVLVGLVVTLLTFKKIDKKYKKLYIFSLIVGISSVIMTLKWFPFEELPAVLKMLQFSFRMLEFSALFLGFIVAINYTTVIKNFKIKDVFILTCISVLLVVPLVKNLNYKENVNENDLWPAVRVTQNTKRVHAGCASFEYLPSKAFEHLDYIKERENRVKVISGNAQVIEEQKSGSDLNFKVQDIDNHTILELPYIYYLGYEATLQTTKEQRKLELHESIHGFIEIHLENRDEGEVILKYKGTSIMKISAIISILSFLGFSLCCCISRKKDKNENDLITHHKIINENDG